MAQLEPLFAIEGLTPHGFCLLWDPGLIWMHVAADAAIAMAYLAIPAALAVVGRRRADLNPHGVLYWFAAFIILCAATHLAGIVTLWQPWYLLAGLLKLACAAVSVVTAALVWRILRYVLDAPSHDRLEAANRDLRELNERLEQRVAERTQALSSAGRRLVVAVYEAREADRIKSDFLARMSHELRTPLNAIIGFTEMLLAGVAGPLRDKQRDYCASVHAAGRQLLEQVDAILDVDLLRRGDAAPTPSRGDLAPICADAVERHRHAAEAGGVSIAFDVPPGVVVWADGQSLRTILANLLSNAVKYSPPGGSVRLQCEQVADGVRIQVTDHGYGVDPASLPRLFEPFFRAHERELPAVGGAGLGLSLVKMLVEAHGGVIDFDSRLREGTTVTLWLPSEETARKDAGADILAFGLGGAATVAL